MVAVHQVSRSKGDEVRSAASDGLSSEAAETGSTEPRLPPGAKATEDISGSDSQRRRDGSPAEEVYRQCLAMRKMMVMCHARAEDACKAGDTHIHE